MKEKIAGYSIILGGFAAVALTAIANWRYGVSMTGDWLQAGMHVVVDVFALGAFIAVGILIARKSFFASFGAAVFGLLFLAYSASNLIGYSASNRISASKAAEMNLANKQAAYNHAKELRKTAFEWAVKTTTDKSVYKSRAKVAGDQVTKLATAQPVTPITVTAKEVMPDAQASMIAKYTKLNIEDVQVFASILGALALILCKPFAGVFGALLLSGKGVKTAPKSKQKQTQDLAQNLPQNLQGNLDAILAAKTDSKILQFQPVKPDENKKTVRDYLSSIDQRSIKWGQLWNGWEKYRQQHSLDRVKPNIFANLVKGAGWRKKNDRYVKEEMSSVAA